MTTFSTLIHAIHNVTGELAVFCDPNLQFPSKQLAIDWCIEHAGYLFVGDEVICEIPVVNGLPDFKNKIDYDHQNN